LRISCIIRGVDNFNGTDGLPLSLSAHASRGRNFGGANNVEAAKALARTAAVTAKASNAAAEAGRIALDQLNKDIANAGVARDAFGGAQRLVSILADKPEFIQRVSDTIKLQGAIVAFSTLDAQ
jgi:hypothetical protein